MKIIKKNKKKTDCGVVAAYNAASWCGLKLKYKEIEKAAKSCGYSDQGIYFFQFTNLLQKLKIPSKQIKPKSLGELESKMYLGKCMIFLYTQTGFQVGHVIMAFMDHTGNIRLINPEGLMNWDQLAAEIYAHGMKSFQVHELPCRETFLDDGP